LEHDSSYIVFTVFKKLTQFVSLWSLNFDNIGYLYIRKTIPRGISLSAIRWYNHQVYFTMSFSFIAIKVGNLITFSVILVWDNFLQKYCV